MFKEYDVVVSKCNLDNVLIGSKGTVLIAYDKNHYEVEFIDEKGDTLNVLTVSESDIQKWE